MKKVDPKQSLPKLEEETLKYWEEHRIFEKSISEEAPSGTFVFYEGPPTANGKPGLHHILARSFKDIIPRYKTMKGYRVQRKAGWDTHGLPVELQVEKKLGLKNKQEIENIVPGDKRASIIEFNKQCKESVWEYKDLWEKMTTRMGYWVDMEHPYVTYDNRYIESVWWQLAQVAKLKDDQGRDMLYRGRKIVPYCYRCGTALSSHEVAQGYQTVKDNSVYVKFKAIPGQKIGDFTTDNQTYFIAWTTTPWTLPGNVALAVGASIKYEYFRISESDVARFHVGDTYILGEERLKKILGGTCTVYDWGYNINFENEGNVSFERKGVFFGRNMLGSSKYVSVFVTDTISEVDKSRSYKIVAGDFVTTDSGTGIVHIAPAFGEDDMNIAQTYVLPVAMTVTEEGKMEEGLPGAGIPVKKKNERNRYAVDDLIIEDLKKRGLFFKEEVYEHEYPFCWRCDTPLIYYAKPSWFIRMSSLSDELVKNNEAINWVPEHIKEGRFGEWLKGVKDWAISRDRFWGTPLPIWVCDHTKRLADNEWQLTNCNQEAVFISSIQELEEKSGTKLEDVHKPFIDDIYWSCDCGGTMTRTPEVLDVWFDSGAMPLAQFHYPNGSTEVEKHAVEDGQYFPADYISEAIDQTRGWFYTLHAVATLLQKAGVVKEGRAYKNVVCLAHIMDAQGKKMSKSRGNVLDPFDLMNEFGADAVRWMLFTMNQPGIPKRFDIKGMRDVQNRVFRMLWNSYLFFVSYAEISDFKPGVSGNEQMSTNILDRWILSELQTLINEVDSRLEAYDVYPAGNAIESFIDQLSNWYIRRSRKRFWKNDNEADKQAAYQTLYNVLVTLAKVMAPFTPFIAEEIYRNLTGEESVHLASYPGVDKNLIDEKLNEGMANARYAVTSGLKIRAKEKVNVRQPLSVLQTNDESLKPFEAILTEELNVRKIEFVENIDRDNPSMAVEYFNPVTVDLNQDSGLIDGARMHITRFVALDTFVTPELKLEGQAREIIRFIQEMRKEAGYDIDDHIRVCYKGGTDIFTRHGEMIARDVLALQCEGVTADPDTADISQSLDLDDEPITFWLRKI